MRKSCKSNVLLQNYLYENGNSAQLKFVEIYKYSIYVVELT